jgi:hypothetical protein
MVWRCCGGRLEKGSFDLDAAALFTAVESCLGARENGIGELVMLGSWGDLIHDLSVRVEVGVICRAGADCLSGDPFWEVGARIVDGERPRGESGRRKGEGRWVVNGRGVFVGLEGLDWVLC